MVVTVAIRRPATTIGSAIGSSTRQKRCVGSVAHAVRRLDHLRRHALQGRDDVADQDEEGVEHQRHDSAVASSGPVSGISRTNSAREGIA